MAGEPNPIQSGNFGQNGDKSMEVALATKMQLILDQPMTDVSTGLVNRDFEGEFFKIGDTVAIIKPDISSLNIKFGSINGETGTAGRGGQAGYDGASGYESKDARLRPTSVSFKKRTMTIDKFTKYAFVISDLTEAEGKWNYESGNLDAVAQEIRKGHNLETLVTVLNQANQSVREEDRVPSVAGAAAAPAQLDVAGRKLGDAIYEDVIVPMYAKLYNAGAITADGQVTYGSNAQQGKTTNACLYVPTKVYTELLISHYLQDRATVAADEKVASGKVKTIMGLDIMIEPSLDTTDASNLARTVKGTDLVEGVAGLAENTLCIVAGTRNLVTRAGKVLPPDKFRSHKYFADEYHGMEIYHEEVVEPKAGVVAFITL